MNQNVICWFEIYVKDIDRAKKFYNAVIGTKFIDADMSSCETSGEMKMAFFSSPENQGVNGALVEVPGYSGGSDGSPHTMVYFPCEDCTIESARVEAAGGKVQQLKMDLGEFGFCSLCTDSEGNPFGLYSMQ